MPALHETARSPRRKRLRLTLAVIAASIATAACSDDTSMQATQDLQQHPAQQAQQRQQPALATTFNAGLTPPADATLPSSQSSFAHAPSAAPGDASAADSVVLAPPVIHTVD